MAQEEGIPGQYIVVLKTAPATGNTSGSTIQAVNAVEAKISSVASAHSVVTNDRYQYAFAGFSASLTDAQVAALRDDEDVDMIEQDRVWHINAQTTPTGISRIDGDVSSTQSGNGSGSVSGVDIFIIDTGIDDGHPDLNVVELKNYVKTAKSGKDDHGHGTHVSGTAAAKDNSSYVVGVAPGAPLHGIKVLDRNGSGTTSAIVNGINYVTGWKNNHTSSPAVANMSLGGYAGTTAYNSMDIAVKNCVAAGVVFCIAAGNSTADAALYTPAHCTEAITVGAYDATTNGFAYFSNFGTVVDINAPGVNVVSTYRGSTTATMSGTSMAAPHVTGTVALYLSSHKTATPAQVIAALQADATTAQGNSTNAGITGVPSGTTTLSVYAGLY
jgi:subtilisin family serine protease